MESFKTPQEVEMWLEYNSPRLSDVQYSNITPELKKKYIALGMDLSSNMIKSSEPEVLRYYISKISINFYCCIYVKIRNVTF